MMYGLYILSVFVLLVFSVPTLVFVVECLIGLLSRRQRISLSQQLPRTAVLIPAHNEAGTIGQTLQNLCEYIDDAVDVLVVADNCEDDTAKVVAEYRFDVIERQNLEQRGKGYALDYGLQHFRAQAIPPEVVIIFDADCFAEKGALERISKLAFENKRPIQSCYLMQRGPIERISIKFSEFAFLIKNKIRMRGADCLGMPVPLTGTGMAFPWELISEAQLATGDIVEDMRLGVELAEAGRGALYCDDAFVYSFFPQSEEAEKTQKTRWEHGHLNTIGSFVPRLIRAAITRGNIQAFGMALDLCVPPFTLLLACLAFGSGAFALASLCGFSFIFVQGYLSLFVLSLSTIAVTWLVAARHILSFGELIKAPLYIISKMFIYASYVLKRQTEWVRTKRD